MTDETTRLVRIATLTGRDGLEFALDRIENELDLATAQALGETLAAIDPWARYRFTPDRLAHAVGRNAPGAVRLLLRADEALAGVAVLKPGWMFGTYLNLLAVLPTHQGRGIGHAFLDWLEAEGRARGERNQFVVSSAFNERALALYESHGFCRIADMPGLISDGETEVLLRRRLG
ncbi:MAG: GNAT family N-acetyltransferase [Hyphomicrobiaceae bacterium]